MRKIFVAFICILSILGCCLLGGGAKASDFTIEEHIQRITERIENSDRDWGFPEGETYQSFAVYPLYNQNEEVYLYLVEFDPYGFVFVRAKDETYVGCAGVGTGMYLLSTIYGKETPWAPHTRDKNSSYLPRSLRFTNGFGDLILNEEGEVIVYYKSPFFVTENIKEKKYMLETTYSSEYICAVKKDSKFINLISGLEVANAKEYIFEENATIDALGYIDKGFEL